MAATILPNTVTRAQVGQALRHYRLTFAGDSRELTAINKAALNLEACLWTWTGDALVIESATQTGLVRYHVQYDVCDCQAAVCGRACWHRAAYRLLKKAAELATGEFHQIAAPRPRRSPEDHARILREAAELA